MSIYATTTLVSTCKFYNESDALFDPTTVVAYVTDPAGADTTYTYGVSPTLTKTGTGDYKLTFSGNKHGEWAVLWQGTHTNGDVATEVRDTITAPKKR